MVPAATRRQRQMASVPATGMSVIPQREGEGIVFVERETERERKERAEHSTEEAADSEEILEKMRTAF